MQITAIEYTLTSKGKPFRGVLIETEDKQDDNTGQILLSNKGKRLYKVYNFKRLIFTLNLDLNKVLRKGN